MTVRLIGAVGEGGLAIEGAAGDIVSLLPLTGIESISGGSPCFQNPVTAFAPNSLDAPSTALTSPCIPHSTTTTLRGRSASRSRT